MNLDKDRDGHIFRPIFLDLHVNLKVGKEKIFGVHQAKYFFQSFNSGEPLLKFDLDESKTPALKGANSLNLELHVKWSPLSDLFLDYMNRCPVDSLPLDAFMALQHDALLDYVAGKSTLTNTQALNRFSKIMGKIMNHWDESKQALKQRNNNTCGANATSSSAGGITAGDKRPATGMTNDAGADESNVHCKKRCPSSSYFQTTLL
mmetsp:Transcript_22528/g.42338  ORF Transcript_22528/g.42338 Transcript_22528/m.42338 type:complete len:205 (+) Transcript_22528:1166-1780(+)